MSKMDNLRAMREARFDRAGTQPARKPAPLRAVRPDEKPPAPVDTDAPAGEELCGHRNIGGRTCTREKGHSAKSHRYS
jgi:hypothetical protein